MKNSLALPQIDTSVGIKLILEELCHSHYGNDGSELDQRIEAFWEAINDTPYMHRRDIAVSLRGGPGHGKTTAFKIASKMFCDGVGLDFVLNPSDRQLDEIHKAGKFGSTFLFVSYEMAGEMSNMTVGGIPSKATMGDEEYMTKLLYKKFAAFNMAAGGTLLLDDMSNASASVQNYALPLMEEKRSQSLELGKAFVGMTGNLGALDGTNIANTSTATASRLQTYQTRDTANNWLARLEAEYKDEIGDALLGVFFKRYEGGANPGELFDKPHARKDGTPFPCPRSWSKLASAVRVNFHQAKYLLKKGRDAQHIAENTARTASAIIGPEVGQKLGSFYADVFSGALPLALEQMETGELCKDSREKFDSLITSKINTAAGATASMQYINALSDEVVFQLSKLRKSGVSPDSNSGQYKALIKNFVDGVYNYGLHHGTIAHAFASFKDKMVIRGDSRKHFGVQTAGGTTAVSEDFAALVGEVVAGNRIANTPMEDDPSRKLYEDTFTEVFTNSISSMAQFDEDNNAEAKSVQAELIAMQEKIASLKNELKPLDVAVNKDSTVFEESVPSPETGVDNDEGNDDGVMPMFSL
tara:strand:+ start:947 stop:2701 length:1755 start_codon:yes stop_codon:yes gene_type:complete